MKDSITRIDKLTADFINSFGSLTNEQLNWKPLLKTWSIAQNIEHLIIVNESYYRMIESIRKDNYRPPFISKINFITSFWGKVLLKSLSPDRKRKIKTFSIFEPKKSEISSNIFKRFEEAQKELKTLVNNSQDLILNGAVISNSAKKIIVYKLETAFEIIIIHEQRHFNQSKEVYNKLVHGG